MVNSYREQHQQQRQEEKEQEEEEQQPQGEDEEEEQQEEEEEKMDVEETDKEKRMDEEEEEEEEKYPGNWSTPHSLCSHSSDVVIFPTGEATQESASQSQLVNIWRTEGKGFVVVGGRGILSCYRCSHR